MRNGGLSKSRGFTLVEIMIGMGVFSLLMLGVMSLFITMLRLCASVNGASSSSLDAARGIQSVSDDLREARSFALMDGGTYGTTYDAVDSTGNYVAVTGIHIVMPAANSSTSVKLTSGGSAQALTGGTSLWDVKNDGVSLNYYRSNTNGTPNPNTGTCLWENGIDQGQAVNRAIIKSVAPLPNAVQFIQPYMPDGVTPIANEVKIKIVSSYYDPIHGYTSSDAANGNVTQLTGECVYLRDHNPFGVTSNGAHGRTQY
ncbi:hypothetical protein CCAX7_43840 [Capsulimonas corticalis]|uniref:Uncharacterized protein n=2 Tax=Capsulimonas corticalis TaxID=2219043 RepID=A0A402CXB1_9BACT|nr:hypothetical protein CCAX7_43840 [Capsulimonas corticalis]